MRYSSDGVFIPVDEMQEKYCPQLMKAYELVPELKATNTMPDGHAYSFPSYGDPQFSGLSRLLAINTDWLEAVDMEMPTTLEEFKEVLIAFRNKDPNGNGQKDEIPLSWMGPIYNSTTGWTFGLEWLADAFQCPSSQAVSYTHLSCGEALKCPVILQILARCGTAFVAFVVKGQVNHDFAFGIEVNSCVIEVTIGNTI